MASAVPESDGVSSFVGLVPVIVGAAGVAVSIRMVNAALTKLVFPAASLALAVSEWLPSNKEDTVME